MVLVDAGNMVIRLTNPTFDRLFGYRAGELGAVAGRHERRQPEAASRDGFEDGGAQRAQAGDRPNSAPAPAAHDGVNARVEIRCSSSGSTTGRLMKRAS